MTNKKDVLAPRRYGAPGFSLRTLCNWSAPYASPGSRDSRVDLARHLEEALDEVRRLRAMVPAEPLTFLEQKALRARTVRLG